MKEKKLRELLKAPEIVRAPGAFDAWSARLVEMAGFPAVYMTGYGASASVLGQPDIGLMTMSEKGSVMTWQAWQHNDRMSTSLGTPMFIPYLFIPLGFFLLALQFAVLIKSGFTPQEDAGGAGQQI